MNGMKLLGALSLMALLAASRPGYAETRFEAALKRIDPVDRLEQVCDYAATVHIGRDKNPYHPDRAVLDPISEPKVSGNTIKGTGGAFRSKGKWYQFSFTCKTTPDRMKVLSFDYKIGAAIPEDKWDALGLWR
jgi:hypothetical protein